MQEYKKSLMYVGYKHINRHQPLGGIRRAKNGIQNTLIIHIHKTEAESPTKRYTKGLEWYTEYCNHIYS